VDEAWEVFKQAFNDCDAIEPLMSCEEDSLATSFIDIKLTKKKLRYACHGQNCRPAMTIYTYTILGRFSTSNPDILSTKLEINVLTKAVAESVHRAKLSQLDIPENNL
jgi:hypothetical protein